MMSEKRFQKARIVDKWGGIYDSETDKVLNVNDVEHKLNEQQATINRQTEQYKARLDKLIEEIGELQMKNVEQQATIQSLKEENRKLKNIHWY